MTEIRRLPIAVVLVLAAVAAATVAIANSPDHVFGTTTEQAQVWVSTWYVDHRSGEAYTPLLVLVRNRGDGEVVVDRDSFTLVDDSGVRHPLATAAEIRGNYHRASFDLSMGRFYGIPVEEELSMARLAPTDFYPRGLASERIENDEASLAPGQWMVDLLYFRTPTSTIDGRSATLRVSAVAWPKPVEVGLEP